MSENMDQVDNGSSELDSLNVLKRMYPDGFAGYRMPGIACLDRL